MATDTAMQPTPAIQPGTCGARNRNGTLCQRVAGWGTDHLGYGNCKNHSGSTPSGRKYAAKGMLYDAAERLGVSLEMEPQDLMLAAVHGTAGQLAWAQTAVAKLPPEEVPGSWALALQSEALDRAQRVSKAALDAGIAERRVRLAERAGALIAAAAERAMGRMANPLPPGDRAEFARLFQAELVVLESGDYEAPET